MYSCILDDNLPLLTMLNIIRNFTMDISNELFVAYSTTFMRHCLIVLMATIESDFEGAVEASKLAFDILVNLCCLFDF